MDGWSAHTHERRFAGPLGKRVKNALLCNRRVRHATSSIYIEITLKARHEKLTRTVGLNGTGTGHRAPALGLGHDKHESVVRAASSVQCPRQGSS